ncbi:MAG: hypothetical protein M1381_03765 [Deltaproteobacteria bacterium]|nr:hypothetical protein [Deltaproteobacteria bacterium]MCL5792498.1 hypothetical protein [Deltaproteobacteria bacterium]
MKKYALIIVLFSGISFSCFNSSGTQPNILNANTESRIRTLLGVPQGAKQVLIISQSSHWDIDWTNTFNGYYTSGVEPIIKQALDMLDANPDYYYSICEIAFLQRYWNDHPEDHARIVKYIKNGHLRIVGGGMTSPDTNLPTGEDLIMDWFYGNQWVYNIAGVKPVTAWQPDSFGHAQSVPDILASLGYKYVGFSRVPGVAGMDQWYGTLPPDPNSFAEKLVTTSLDFVWKGTGGAEVLAHYLIGGYGFGDLPYASFTQAEANQAFNQFVSKLKPISPTGYMFVPVGSDFMPPNKYLPGLVSGYDNSAYQSTGVWITMATFEDYMKLVSFHENKLPVYAVDLNPYFTGYFGSRPKLKKLSRETTGTLLAAQLYSIIAGNAGYIYPSGSFNNVWPLFLLSDHHDWIPGTSTDDVYYGEQIPVMEETLNDADELEQTATTYIANQLNTSSIKAADIPLIVFNPSGFIRSDIAQVSVSFNNPGTKSIGIVDQSGTPVPSQIITETTYNDGSINSAIVMLNVNNIPSLGYVVYTIITGNTSPLTGTTMTTDAQGNVVLSNQYETLVLGKNAGYAITSLVDNSSDTQMISGPSNDIEYYEDTGDMWSIGSEPDAGFVFTPIYALSQTTSTYTVLANGPVFTEVQVKTNGLYGSVIRTYTMYKSLKRIDMSTTLAAPTGTTIAAVFSTTISSGIDRMAIPYGIIQRPFKSMYTPQFWPGVEWVDLLNPTTNAGVAMFDIGNEMWSFNDKGTIVMGLVRNPPTDTSCGLKGACGTDNDTHTLDYALLSHASGSFDVREGYAFSSPLTATVTSVHNGTLPLSYSLASSNDTNALITAVKESKNNNGIILRLFRLTPSPSQTSITVTDSNINISGAMTDDSFEDPIGKPVIKGSTISLDMTGTISTLFLPSK